VGTSTPSGEALSHAPIFVGSRPVTREEREGAQSGEAQYAEVKTADLAAKASMWGVFIGEDSLWMRRSGAET
jgi:hypothetical protein